MILSGKQLSDNLKAQMKEQVAVFPEKYGRVPHLVVILVGEDPASVTYVRNKGKAADKVGIRNTTIRLDASTTQEELLSRIAELNADAGVDGILVQLPLPKHMDEQTVISAIDKSKDVDGFHPANVAALWSSRSKPGTEDFCVACTPKGIMKLIATAGTQVEGKHAVVVGRSNIVGLPVAKLLLNANATVTICHSRTPDLAAVTREADILVAAIGRPRMITADMVKEGATVIDVGINRLPDGTLCGDVDYENVAPKTGAITPVPGGVGHMTICCLMENTIECFLSKMECSQR